MQCRESPHEVKVERARLAKVLALHNTGDHAVVDGAEIGDGGEIIEDHSSGHEVFVFHATQLSTRQ